MRLAALSVLLAPAAAGAMPTTHARLDDWSMRFRVQADLTYTETFSQDWTLLTERGVAQNSRAAVNFHPDSQQLELLEAWVIQPDGARIDVAPGAIFTRPSQAAQEAPGFTASQTMTVVFPQLHPGSRTHIAWRLTQKQPPLNGFNLWVQVPLEVPVGHISITLESPATLGLHTAARGGFVQASTEAGSVRIQTASIDDTHAASPEPDAVDASDYQPLFLATSLPSAEAMGAIYARASAPRAQPGEEVSALAARIAGQKTGLNAARAIYDWVAANIRYVAVYLNPNDGWVPHDAGAVLRAGYGDCKDHVVLMQALLRARGIAAAPALVSYGEAFSPLPLWLPTQYNHAIIYLPEWHRFANPTDPFASFDSADRRLAGKQVVLATGQGTLAQIPPRVAAEDTYRMDSELELQTDGTILGRATLALSPSIDSPARRMVAHALSPQDLAQQMLDETAEGGSGSVTSSDPRDLDTRFTMQAEWRSPHAVALHDGRGYAPLPTGVDLEPAATLRAMLSPRGAPTHDFTAGALDFTWHVTWHLPAGLAVTRLPPDVTLANTAGSYEANYRARGAVIEVTRHLQVARDVFAPGDYAAFDALIQLPLADAREVVGLGATAEVRASL